MDAERWARIKSIFFAAAELPEAERSAFIRSRCDGDETLSLEIESLLAAHDRAGSFIEALPAVEATAALEDLAIEPMVGRQIGHYKVTSHIGRGGMGAVYLAEDTRLGRRVAIKLLREGFTTDQSHLRRFEQEARAASALNHPNIVTIYDIGEAEVGRFIVMEFIEGRTLREVAGRPLSLETVLKLCGQIAKALDVAYTAGIIHRDIKPENIMVRGDGYVKVLDFGVARLAAARNAELSVDEERGTQLSAGSVVETNPGTIVGTPAYMSPEQAARRPLTGAADIFSSGIILYELATGQHPFKRDSQLACLHAIIEEPPIAPSRLNPEIPPALEALILRMLEKEPRLRPDAGEVGRAVAEIERVLLKGAGAEGVSRFDLTRRHTVGREQERRELRAAFERAAAGKGLMVGLAGEAGIGKTTLVEDFLAELAAGGRPCTVARGRGSERLAGTEAYLPFLEMLESLIRQDSGQSNAHAMRQLAPTWYIQISPFSADDSSAVRIMAEVKVSSQERMKREMVALLQEISRVRPLIIFFDDVHWADASTINLLAYVAARLDSMRALIAVTYRPSELMLARHPFSQVKLDLQGRGICHELALDFLSREDVERYLGLEFPGHNFDEEFLPLIYKKTEGNPLFMADLLRYLRDRRIIDEENGQWVLARSVQSLESEMPESVRSMIQRKIDQLNEQDRRLLVAASVQGYEFDSAVVSGAVGADAAEVEERLEALERVFALVRLVGEKELPDGTLTQRHRFIHVLYQNALYASLRPTRRASLSKAVAETLTTRYGERRSEVASELAHLFETAREFGRAAGYFLVAAQRAVQVFAYREAAELARRGLGLLEKLPAGLERSRQEIGLHIVLAFSVAVTKGYGAPETGTNFIRAREICQQVGETHLIFSALWGEIAYRGIRAELATARELAEEFLRISRDTRDPMVLIAAHFVLGFILRYLGDFVSSQEHLEQAMSLHDPDQNLAYRALYSVDPGIWSRGVTIGNLWALGYPEQSRRRMEEAISLAQKASEPRAMAFILVFAAFHFRSSGEAEKVREQAERCIALCDEHGMSHERESVGVAYGWALARQGYVEEGFTQIRESIATHNARGSMISTSQYLAVLADAYATAGRIDEALDSVTKGLEFVNANGERHYEAELYRLKGELLLARASDDENRRAASTRVDAEACFQQAIEVARRQRVKSWELRAALSLARLWQKQGKRTEARDMLKEIYGWFTEGFETFDLKRAGALLEELS